MLIGGSALAAETEFSLLGRYSVVYFGNDWKAENRTSSHHVATRLARRLPLLYVDCPGLRAPALTARDLRRSVRKIVEALRAPRQITPQMWHCTLPQIPFRRHPAVTGLNRSLARYLLIRWIRRLSWNRIISWFVVPHPGFLARQLGEDYVVYYCTDDYSLLPGVDRASIASLDQELTRCADQVFAVSSPLLEAKRALNPATAYAPHGVDFDLFATASDPATHPPDEAAHLNHPVIGYFGVLDAKLDIQLLVSLAEARPQWTFLFVGRTTPEAAALSRFPNVVLVGPQPYDSLPRWASAFDVAIMPYVRNAQIHCSNPLKLREYLATGKPVVSVPTPEVETLKDFVRLARSPADFLAQIEDVLQSDTPAHRQARQAAVAAMSWDARVAHALAFLEQGLARKSRSCTLGS
jgi:glycosyltransferase involved in cell wall biosynthesis